MVLVDPPIAKSRINPLSIDFFVTISFGLILFFKIYLSVSAVFSINLILSGFIFHLKFFLSVQAAAGIEPLPGRARPMTSAIQFMEFAVNMPAQLPHVLQELPAKASNSFSVILLADFLPTPSKTVTKSELFLPASIG